jgi:O-antigen/teichoic acid export membrane protein
MRLQFELNAIRTRLASSLIFQNIVSNYMAAVWMAVLSLVAIPIYLRLLGPAQWSIVAVCITFQGILGMLDAGLSQLMPRGLARVAGDNAKEAQGYGLYNRLYVALAIAGFALGQLTVHPIVLYWLKAPDVSPLELKLALRLVLFQFLFQFANNANIGYWNGVQLQKRANLRLCLFGTAKAASAVLVVSIFARNAFGYLLPFVVVTLVEWRVNRSSILRHFDKLALPPAKVSKSDVLAVAKEGGSLTAGILVGVLVSQLDRLYLTATQSLTEYGAYLIVASFGLAFMQLQYPVLRAFFPQIVRDEADGIKRRSNSAASLLIGVTIFCVIPCLLLIVFTPEMLRFWLRNRHVVEVGVAPLRLILLAVAVNAIYSVIYLRIIAAGRSGVVIVINGCMLLSAGLVVSLANPTMGIAIGGLIWITTTVTQLALGCLWLAFSSSQNRVGSSNCR